MKKIILLSGFIILSTLSAHAKIDVPQGRFIFSLSKEYGSLREIQVTFHSEDREGVETLVADIVGTSPKGKVDDGDIACVPNDDESEIKCDRNDGGGSFTLVKGKTISGKSFKYSLKFHSFAFGEEGSKNPVTFTSDSDKPAVIPGKQVK